MQRLDYEILQGACDIHVHSAPSLFHRHEAIAIAKHSREMGLSAIVLKNHHFPTMDRAESVAQIVSGIDIFGSITLNYSVGGLNPFAVDAAIKLGAKAVWLPTIDSFQQKEYYGCLGGYGSFQSPDITEVYSSVQGIKICDQRGILLPQMKEILQLIAKSNVILACGHMTIGEIELLVKEAKACGVKKIIIDHPHLPFLNLSLKKQQNLIHSGAKINYCFSEISPKWWCIPVPQIATHINHLGPENLILSSDLGQIHNPLPAEGLRIFIQLLLEEGIDPESIKKMLVDNSSALIYG